MYPITLIKTRYQGTYEGGKWAAFNLYPEDIPLAATGSDNCCAEWWYEKGKEKFVAVGATEQVALIKLLAKNEEDGTT